MQNLPIEVVTIVHGFGFGYGTGAAFAYIWLFDKHKKRNPNGLSEFFHGMSIIGLGWLGIFLPGIAFVEVVSLADFLSGWLAFFGLVCGFITSTIIGFRLVSRDEREH